VADFMTTDLEALGSFDVVLYLGVLYHIREPLTALQRVRQVAKEVAVVESEAVEIRGHSGDSLLQFMAGSDLREDFGNWYVPTEAALHQMCRAAGFSRVVTRRGPPTSPRAFARSLVRPEGRYRILLHAFV
jgi:tRNA (mo5U34)-methyltransferase